MGSTGNGQHLDWDPGSDEPKRGGSLGPDGDLQDGDLQLSVRQSFFAGSVEGSGGGGQWRSVTEKKTRTGLSTLARGRGFCTGRKFPTRARARGSPYP
jgi:hypothetical protein